jgi:acetate kinase
MDLKTVAQLEALRKELHEISGKLETEAEEIRKGFHGIGNEYCAERLAEVVKEYRKLEKRIVAAMTAQNTN